MWNELIPAENPEHKDLRILLIDSEGLGNSGQKGCGSDSRIFMISLLLSSFFIYNSYQVSPGTTFINENTIIIILICVIVVFPLLLFMLPSSPSNSIKKASFTQKRELLTKRKRKTGYLPLNRNKQGKIY